MFLRFFDVFLTNFWKKIFDDFFILTNFLYLTIFWRIFWIFFWQFFRFDEFFRYDDFLTIWRFFEEFFDDFLNYFLGSRFWTQQINLESAMVTFYVIIFKESTQRWSNWSHLILFSSVEMHQTWRKSPHGPILLWAMELWEKCPDTFLDGWSWKMLVNILAIPSGGVVQHLLRKEQRLRKPFL